MFNISADLSKKKSTRHLKKTRESCFHHLHTHTPAAMSDWTVVPKGGGSRGKVPAQQPRQPQPAAQNLEAGAGAGVPFDGAFDPIFSVDILICVDLEATCDEDDGDYKSVIPRDQQEIIEFPFVAIDVASGSIMQTVQQ